MTHAEKIAIFNAADAVFNAALDAADGLNGEPRRKALNAASEALRAAYATTDAPAPCALRLSHLRDVRNGARAKLNSAQGDDYAVARAEYDVAVAVYESHAETFGVVAPALCTLRPTVDSVAPGATPCLFADDGTHLILIAPRDGIRTLTYDLYVTEHATGKTTLYPTFYSIRTALRTANRLHGTDCREAIAPPAPAAKRYGVRRVITGADGAVQHDQTTGNYATFALACAAVHADYPPREGRADLRFTDSVAYRIGNCAVQVTAAARD